MAKATKKNTFNVKVEKKPESPIGDSEALEKKIEETSEIVESSSVVDDIAQHPKFAKFNSSLGDTKNDK